MTEEDKGYTEIKMSSGWFMTISMQKSDKFEEEKEYVEIAKERSGQKRGRFNINPKYVRTLGEALVKFADENKL
ncbi:MAG: hypothetical protein OIN86_01745 [Candidatus Methanoperedens sp.]|jgi:hypothetical protein|nr:hypothetical protein [Candidatus Methanoperedens sp.]CAG1008074.1 hypothetical protein METP1_03543 [Methanosarcinales archaeon]